MNTDIRFTNIAPVFVSSNVKATVKYYTEILGFQYAEHFDKIDNFAAIYKDEVELIIVQKQKGTIESNNTKYGAGYDTYINVNSIEGINALYNDYKTKNVKTLSTPHMTDYGSFEFSIEDIDGRIIGIGQIADKITFFSKSNYI